MDQRLDDWLDSWMNGSVVLVMWINEYLIDGRFYGIIYLRVGSCINGWAEVWTCRILVTFVGSYAVMCV
jgi:hypothetical protein